MSFSQDLDKATLNLAGYAEDMVRGTLFALASRIIKESPVDTGRFRGNWQASLNTPKQGKLQRLDKSGAGPINDMSSVVNDTVIDLRIPGGDTARDIDRIT